MYDAGTAKTYEPTCLDTRLVRVDAGCEPTCAGCDATVAETNLVLVTDGVDEVFCVKCAAAYGWLEEGV